MDSASALPSDAVAQLAADLRAQRHEAGNPTLMRLQEQTGISKTMLSSAFSGKHLPSARTVDRIARALGGDHEELIRRRDAIAAELGRPVVGEESEVVDAGEPIAASAAPEARPRRSFSRRATVMMVVGAFLFGVVLTGGTSWFVASSVVAEATKPASERAQINVHNGVDPALTPCVDDAKVATASERTNNTRLEIVWSNKCYAGWARVHRFDEQVTGNSMTVAIYPEDDAQGPDRQSATEPDVQGAYTTLVVRPEPETRLCAVAVITLDGASIDLGEPLCT